MISGYNKVKLVFHQTKHLLRKTDCLKIEQRRLNIKLFD